MAMFDQILGLAAPDAISPSALDLAKAEDAVARLDERLATSPIAVAFRARTHVHDAGAAVFSGGRIGPRSTTSSSMTPPPTSDPPPTPLRVPTQPCAPAAGSPPRSRAGPRAPVSTSCAACHRPTAPRKNRQNTRTRSRQRKMRSPPNSPPSMPCWRGPTGFWTAIPSRPRQTCSTLADKDRLEEWLGHLRSTEHMIPVLAAALAGAALDTLAPLPNQAWLGRLLIADLLRTRGKTRHHLPALNLGMKLAHAIAIGVGRIEPRSGSQPSPQPPRPG